MRNSHALTAMEGPVRASSLPDNRSLQRKHSMKTLALALLIPMTVCTACGKKTETFATAAPAPVDAAVNTPATPAPPPASAPVPPAPPTPVTAHVTLASATGSSVKGDLTLTNEGTEVSIQGQITGLAPGKEHGFHVHETGQCSLPDFKSAGEHFNPTKDPHGGPNATPRHLGDIANAKADESGRATIDVKVKGATLGDKDAGPGEILGKALVVHAMPDDYKTQPSGGSGDRVACGVIR
jgi:superoxide dismutase, Cu-Zn family